MSAKRIALFPASLDPIHYGHIDIALRASRIFDELIVAIYAKPGKRGLLLSLAERTRLAEEAFEKYPRVSVAQYEGLTVEYARTVGAVALVRGVRASGDLEYEMRMGMANKKLAPNLETVALLCDQRHMHVSSSLVREIAGLGGDVSSMAPSNVVEALRRRFEA